MLRLGMLLGIVVIPAVVASNQLPFELREEWSKDALNMMPVDINNDKIDELLWRISSGGKDHINILDSNAVFLGWYPSPELLNDYITTADIDCDGRREIFCSFQKAGILYLSALSSRIDTSNLIGKINTFPVIRQAKWDHQILAVDTVTVGDRKAPDILITIWCGLSLQPRGIAAYDVKTGKEDWHYWMGSLPDLVLVEDINRDNEPEVVIGTYALHNGSKANNTDDDHSYIIVLDRNGNFLWEKKIGPYWTGVVPKISDLELDGKKEIVYVTYSMAAGVQPYTGELSILDAQTGEDNLIIKPGGSFWGLLLKDINHDRKSEIITGNSDGKIRVFDKDLNEKSLDLGSGVELWIASDLNGDGRVELIATTEDSRLVVLTEKLEKCAELKLPYPIITPGYRGVISPVMSVRAGRINKILVQQQHQFSLLDLRVAVPLSAKARNFLLPFILGSLCFLFIFLYIRKTFFPGIPGLTRTLALKTKTGVLYLDRERRVKFVNDAFCKLLGIEQESIINKPFDKSMVQIGLDLNKSTDRISIKTPAGDKNIGIHITNLKRNRLLIQLEDASREDYARKMEAWAPVAQKLAHGVKNPLSHIRLAVQQLRKLIPENQAHKAGQYSNVVLEEVNRLIKIVDGFMKFTDLKPPNPKPVNPNAIIERLIEKIRPVLPKGVNLEFISAKEIPLLNLDEQQMEDALMNPLDNALSAIGDKGTVTISTALLEMVDKPPEILPYVEIQISDTGPGIPEEYLAKLFQPYFTTKPEGSGLGLCITKKIIEDHGGTIKIDSKPGLGTTVTIQLPEEGIPS